MKGMSNSAIKTIPVEEAIGQVLCHDLTRIVPGEMKGPQFRKGHIITPEDIPMLLSMGKEHIYVWEKQPGMVHEDEAAERLAAICLGRGITRKGPSEGKIELFAGEDGLFYYDRDILDRINGIEDLVIAARHSNSVVKAGDKLAGMKAIPLLIKEENLRRAEEAAGAGEKPLMEVLPYILEDVWVIVTGNEVAAGRVPDSFGPILEKKLAAFGIKVRGRTIVPDGTDRVAEAIAAARREHPGMILCTGGMSVDPDDHTPGAIRRSGAQVVTYGAPVIPGAMFLLAYFDDGVPILGIPGCVMYGASTVFDLILPRIAAGQRLRREDVIRMGAGGLCLGCPVCRYPVCPFGKF